MDVALPAPAPAHGSHFFKYMEVAVVLAILTGLEIIIIWLPFAFWPIFLALVVLSVAKFVYVIAFFMHLRWDPKLCTIIFLLGLFIAGATAWVLHLLFSVEDSKPYSLSQAPALRPAPTATA